MVTQNGVEHLLSSIYVGNLELKKMHLELVFVGSFKFLTWTSRIMEHFAPYRRRSKTIATETEVCSIWFY